MLFGDKQRFGIEYALDDSSGGVWLFGRCCYWICGNEVGDYELGTTLRDVLFSLERVSCDRGKRASPDLRGLDARELLDTLHNSMYGDEADEELCQRALDEQWARHHINPVADVFDGWSIYLVEDDAVGRLIYRDWPTNTCRECRLVTGEFDTVLADFLASLLSLWEEAVRVAAS